MADVVRDQWQPSLDSGLLRRDRRGGPYDAYIPDPIAGRSIAIGSELGRKSAQAERVVRALSVGPGSDALEGISRLLLRSEAIASSMIEGIAPSPQQVAIAELAEDEQVRGFSEQARLVANNIQVLRRASSELYTLENVAVEDIVRLHASLLPDERQHRGLRTVQNWIGGSNWHPLDAQFVPPPPIHVKPLIEDLVEYINGSAHATLVQAALMHAQFETIHPFTDGNGRVGRALIHTVLTRRGLTRGAKLPVSLVLATLHHDYVDGLNAYRYHGASDSEEAVKGTRQWLHTFLDASIIAASQAQQLATDVAELRADWEDQLARYRTSHGLRAAPRSGSAIAKLLQTLPEVPIMTTRTVQRLLNISFPPARAALDELADAGILTRRSVENNTTGYLATGVFSLVTYAERRMASTQFDTRIALPGRPVAARPPVAPGGYTD